MEVSCLSTKLSLMDFLRNAATAGVTVPPLRVYILSVVRNITILVLLPGLVFRTKRSWPFCVLITRIKPRQLLERRRFVCSVARRTRSVNSCSVRPVDTTIMVAASTLQSPSHLRYGQAGSVLTVRCARCADNQEKTVRCWSVTHVTRVTTPSV